MKPNRPGFAGVSSELAAQAYRNGTSAATSRQFSLSTRNSFRSM